MESILSGWINSVVHDGLMILIYYFEKIFKTNIKIIIISDLVDEVY